MEHKLSLSTMIQYLRKEIEIAQENASASNIKFTMGEVEMELNVEISASEKGKAGVKFWIIEAGGELANSNKAAHKIKIKMTPTLINDSERDDVTLSSFNDGVMGEN